MLEYIKNGEKARQEFDCVVLREEEFTEELSWNAFVFNNCFDKVGRPIFWLRWGKWFPEANTERQMVRFFCFMVDKIAANMPAHVDQYMMVYDFDGCGYSNFSKSHATTLMPFLQTVFCDRQYCTSIIRLPWVVNTLKSVVMPFIHPRTAAKFMIFGSDWKEKLKELVTDDNLPEMYGGSRENNN